MLLSRSGRTDGIALALEHHRSTAATERVVGSPTISFSVEELGFALQTTELADTPRPDDRLFAQEVSVTFNPYSNVGYVSYQRLKPLACRWTPVLPTRTRRTPLQ